jgi:hypothetical protein
MSWSNEAQLYDLSEGCDKLAAAKRIRISPARPAITLAVLALQRSGLCRYPAGQ